MIDDVAFPTGWLDTSPHPTPDGPAVVAYLRQRGVLADVLVRAVRALDAATTAGAAVELTVATDVAEDRALVLREGAVAPGPRLTEVVEDLVRTFGGAAEIGLAFAGGFQPDEAEVPEGQEADDVDAPQSVPLATEAAGVSGLPRVGVIVSRLKPELAVTVARSIGTPVHTAAVDGWTVIVPDAGTDVSDHVWFGPDLPVVGLWRLDGMRYLDVRTERGLGWGHVLGPLDRARATFEPGEAHGDAVMILTWLAHPQQRPGSPAREVLAHPAFAHVPFDRLDQALHEPDDDAWFGRVLDLLGLPSVAADVVEGRAELPDSSVVVPTGLGSTLVHALDGYVERVRRPGAARGWERMSAAAVRRPGLAWALVAVEGLLGAAGAWWAATTVPRPWWLVAIGVAGGLLVLDALLDGLMLVRARRQTDRH